MFAGWSFPFHALGGRLVEACLPTVADGAVGQRWGEGGPVVQWCGRGVSARGDAHSSVLLARFNIVGLLCKVTCGDWGRATATLLILPSGRSTPAWTPPANLCFGAGSWDHQHPHGWTRDGGLTFRGTCFCPYGTGLPVDLGLCCVLRTAQYGARVPFDGLRGTCPCPLILSHHGAHAVHSCVCVDTFCRTLAHTPVVRRKGPPRAEGSDGAVAHRKRPLYLSIPFPCLQVVPMTGPGASGSWELCIQRDWIAVADRGPGEWACRRNRIVASTLAAAKAACQSDPRCYAVAEPAGPARLRSGAYAAGTFYGLSSEPGCHQCAWPDPLFTGWKVHYRQSRHTDPVPDRLGHLRTIEVVQDGTCRFYNEGGPAVAVFTSGTCATNAYYPIPTEEGCAQAGHRLGLAGTPAGTAPGSMAYCSIVEGGAEKLVHFNAPPEPSTSCTLTNPCVCSGQYVLRLTRPSGPGPHHLHIREIEAYSGTGERRPLALAAPPTDPHGAAAGQGPERTIDGDYDTQYHSNHSEGPGERWVEWVLADGGAMPAVVKLWNSVQDSSLLVGCALTVRVRYAPRAGPCRPRLPTSPPPAPLPNGNPDSPFCPVQWPVQWVLGTITQKQAILDTHLSLVPAFPCILDQTMPCNVCHSKNAETIVFVFGQGGLLCPSTEAS